MGQVPSPRGETESVDPLDLGIAAEPALPAGTLVGGRHRIGAVLGRGGYAVVYRACDEATGTAVALKVLRADRVSAVAVRRLQREAETAAALDHPGLVPVLDHGLAEQGPYLAMELVEGETLRERLARGPLPVAEATRLAAALAETLDALHAHGLVHRDLKPSNVLLGADGQPRIADLGLVTALADDDATRATRADGLVGTMEYLSPEQALGRAVDARSDLYSLGIVLFEMLAGQLPFAAQSSLGSVLARVTEAPAPLSDSRPDAPPWLVGVVHKLLAREPGQRYGSAAELAADLRAERGPALPAPAAPVAPPARITRRSHAVAFGAVALAILAAGAALRPRITPPTPGPRLTAVHVVDGALRGKDAEGRVLWVHRPPVPLLDRAYAAPETDGDGVRLWLRTSGAEQQVWLIAPEGPKGPGVLHAFSAEGRPLWIRAPGRPVHFGAERFDRFSANRLHALTDARGRRRVFLSVAHNPWFPGALEELGPDGRTVAEYWSPGHVTSVARVRFGGRDALAVGSYHNETRGAGLALLDLENPSGRMPAVAEKFRCSDCGSRDPLAALAFPGSDALRASSAGQGAAQVMEVHDSEAGLAVTVRQARHRSEVDGRDVDAVVRYELDAEARRVLGVVAGDGYLRLHERLRAAGEIDHPFGDDDLRELARVRRWDGTGWSELPSALPARAGSPGA
ncbi:MAG: serine/threonine protein kinase [Vicinamibacteria bacterium]|nr:serine/threonine protein kinase [Vicinamibacteria bacterium]